MNIKLKFVKLNMQIDESFNTPFCRVDTSRKTVSIGESDFGGKNKPTKRIFQPANFGRILYEFCTNFVSVISNR